MPAPTALVKTPTTPLAADIPLPTPDHDEELLLDASDALTTEPSTLEPLADIPEAMIIDEEGRPRFAPAKDIVCPFLDQLRKSEANNS
jgi:RNA-binding protein PNO1